MLILFINDSNDKNDVFVGFQDFGIPMKKII